MKAAPFAYRRAESLEEALDLLATHGAEAKLIAGGQSLVPMMAMRLARPALLVDINRLPGLKGVAFGPQRAVIGATTRQRDLELDAALQRAVPLLPAALAWVGHVQTRNRGTLGGSLAHADPSAELPLAAAVLDATLVLRSRDGGERRLPAREFFLAPMVTAAREQECLTAIEWPIWDGPGVACAFEEVAIRHGDFAIASAACQIQCDAEGRCRRAAFGLGGVAGTPLVFPDLARQLIGRHITDALAREVAQAAAARTEPGSDTHADAEYRRHLAAVLLRRALLRAGAAPARAAA
ncbi:MAG: FAD binding domain-containing protein [Rhodovarius sp.]|nr:FAD binding domain-containing protein [Rhodovarius sp.]MCX7933612.1 FAD binding domain-containing protein [Rhodovarius sp.]MDW8313659.1 FAD binding domain-containing protein [Rhodovarius sp.]